MAKAKKKTVTLEMSVNASFSLKVPKANQAVFEKDLKRGEICINAQIRHGHQIAFMEIYPDHFSEGGLKVGKFSGETCQIEFSGKVLKEIDPNFFDDLVPALNKAGSLPLVLADISSSSDPFYKDGDDSAVVNIGIARLV
jgi:hypothetical protein